MDPISPISLRTLLATSGSARSDIAHADIVVPGGSYRRRSARIVGTENIGYDRDGFAHQMQTTVQSYDDVVRIVLKDATVCGQGTVISKRGRLLAESAAEFLNHHHAPDGLRAVGPGQFALNAPPERYISVPSILVKRPSWRNYGHWLVDGAACSRRFPRYECRPNGRSW